MVKEGAKGASMYDVRTEEGRGSGNTTILRTNSLYVDIADRGGRRSKNPIIVWTSLGKPPKVE